METLDQCGIDGIQVFKSGAKTAAGARFLEQVASGEKFSENEGAQELAEQALNQVPVEDQLADLLDDLDTDDDDGGVEIDDFDDVFNSLVETIRPDTEFSDDFGDMTTEQLREFAQNSSGTNTAPTQMNPETERMLADLLDDGDSASDDDFASIEDLENALGGRLRAAQPEQPPRRRRRRNS